jgi:hypothetical protein
MADEKPLLNEDQARVAQKIIDIATKEGVNPDFALAIAMQENWFGNKKSPKGAIGPMQLMPPTAKQMGVDPYDEDDNILGGMRYIKYLVADKNVGLDPIRVLAGYNAGPGTKFFKTNDVNDLPTETLDYIDRVHGFAGNDFPSILIPADASSGEASGEDTEKSGNGTVEVSQEDADRQMAEKRLAVMQGLGAVGGAGAANAMDLTARAGRGVGNAILSAIERGAERGAQRPDAPNGALPTGSTATMPPTGGTDVPTPSDQSVRILRGGEGDTLGTTGRARQEGYNIETGQRSANRRGMDAINPQTSQFLASMPGLTSSPSGIVYPRTQARPTIGPRPESALPSNQPPPQEQDWMRMQQDWLARFNNTNPGEPTFSGQFPPRPSQPPAQPGQPRVPLARSAINAGRQAMNLPVIAPTMAGGVGGYSAVTQGNQALQALQQNDNTKAGISTAGVLGSGMMTLPGTRAKLIGGALAAAAPLANQIVDYMRSTSPIEQNKMQQGRR